MIEIATSEAPQGSQTWHDLRTGIPTASQFSRIVTPTGRMSAAREEYMAELLAAYFVGEPDTEAEGYLSEWVERGKQLEPQAKSAYSLVTGQEWRGVGFCFRDDTRMVGCSPDGLVDDDGGVECKCPMARTHLVWLARNVCPREHVAQVQGSLYVTGRQWWDFVSYYPGLPLLLIRVEPDPVYQAGLAEHLPAFVEDLQEARKRLIGLGVPDPRALLAETESDRQWAERMGLL